MRVMITFPWSGGTIEHATGTDRTLRDPRLSILDTLDVAHAVARRDMFACRCDADAAEVEQRTSNRPRDPFLSNTAYPEAL